MKKKQQKIHKTGKNVERGLSYMNPMKESNLKKKFTQFSRTQQ